MPSNRDKSPSPRPKSRILAALGDTADDLHGYEPPPEVPDLSSVPSEARPTEAERATDERATRFEPTPAARDWFEDAWSEKAILARKKRMNLPEIPREAYPEGWEPVPFAAGSGLVFNIESLTYARLVRCHHALTKSGIPSGATAAERIEHAERIVYIHRLCTDPDLDYRGEPFRGVNRRAWVLPFQRLSESRLPLKLRSLATWYGIVEWALRQLDSLPSQNAVPARKATKRSEEEWRGLDGLLLVKLLENPDISDTDLAKLVGIRRQALYEKDREGKLRPPNFTKARAEQGKAAEEEKRRRPRGRVTSAGLEGFEYVCTRCGKTTRQMHSIATGYELCETCESET